MVKETVKPVFILLIFIILHVSAAFAADATTELSLSAGYRQDNLDWNIAGDLSGANPNILSELKWTGIGSFNIKAGLKAVFNKALYVRGAFSGGRSSSGENQDSDYSGDNRTGEFSRSNNKGGGDVWDASAGVGIKSAHRYSSGLNANRHSSGLFEFIPLIGYSYHRQSLKITDGRQTIPATGAFSGLDSSYDVEWIGPWVGADFAFRRPDLNFYGSMEFHVASYHAEADWNLRTDFRHPTSFEHFASGGGAVFSGAMDFPVSKGSPWLFSASVDMQAFQTTGGLDRTYMATGAIIDTELNEVNWNSFSLMAGLKRGF